MRFDVRFNLSSKQIPVHFEETNQSFDTIFDEVKIVKVKEEAEFYEGDYEVTPTVEGFELATAQKMMKDDFTVKAIPYAEVTNTANGLTVTIAD